MQITVGVLVSLAVVLASINPCWARQMFLRRPLTSSVTKYCHTQDERAVVVVSEVTSEIESEGARLEADIIERCRDEADLVTGVLVSGFDIYDIPRFNVKFLKLVDRESRQYYSSQKMVL